MLKRIVNLFLYLGFFLVTGLAIAMTIWIMEFNPALPDGAAILSVYLLMFAAAAFGLSRFRDRISFVGVLAAFVLGLLLLVLPKALMSSLNFTLKILPVLIAMGLGLWSGKLYAFRDMRKLVPALMIGCFPLIMALGPYDLWVHKLEFGTFTGELTEAEVVPFTLQDRNGIQVTQASLEGKVVLFDFWYIGCQPCMVKFPYLQEVYDRYQNDPRVAIFAVNRPMRRDEPGQAFQVLEDRGYTFPVLKGSQEVIDAFGVRFYPTVTLMSSRGELVFAGELDAAVQKLQLLLEAQ